MNDRIHSSDWSRVDRSNMLVEHCGRTVRVKAMPIGIPYDR